MIAKECRENIMFMWLSGGAKPDYITINRFRSERMKDVIIDIFAEVVDLLHREEYIKLENYFLDGTKIEANANKYSWVWGKSPKRYKENLRKKCEELLQGIDKMNKEENEAYGDNDLEELGGDKEIDSQAIREAAERINERLRKSPDDKELKKAKKLIEKDYLPRMEKYGGTAKERDSRCRIWQRRELRIPAKRRPEQLRKIQHLPQRSQQEMETRS